MSKIENKTVRRRLAWARVSTVVSISLVLLLVGAGFIIMLNAGEVSAYFKEHVRLSVILEDGVDGDAAKAVEEKISHLEYVRECEYISEEKGRQEMAQLLGSDFLDLFGGAMLPVSIDLTLDADYVNSQKLQQIRLELEAIEGVSEVVSESGDAIDALDDNLAKVGLILMVMVLMLLFISVALINNMVRMSIFSKRFTIHTMRLVGATKAFICRPFILKSILQGLVAGVLANLVLSATLFALQNGFPELFGIFSLKMLLISMGLVFVSGILICGICTFFVVNRSISFGRDELYAF